MTQSTEQERAEWARAAKEFAVYLKDCEGCSVVPDAAGAFNWAWQAARRAPVVPQGWRAGILAVADLLKKKADAFADAHGHSDMGALSFGQGAHADTKLDHHSNLLELEEEVRDMLAAAPQPPEALMRGNPATKKEASPVQLPEPWGHCVAGQVFVSRELPAHIKPLVESREFLDIRLYTEQQVRQLLAAQEQST